MTSVAIGIGVTAVAIGAFWLYCWACMELIYAHYGGKDAYLETKRRQAEIHAEYERRFGHE